jgi:hypothetical protein
MPEEVCSAPGQLLQQSPIESARWLLCHAFRDERARKIGHVRSQCCLNERQMYEITLGEAAATSIDNVAHASQQFHAAAVVTFSEGE